MGKGRQEYKRGRGGNIKEKGMNSGKKETTEIKGVQGNVK